MPGLRPAELVDLWDGAAHLSPARRALVALSLAGREATEGTVGQRDAALLELYASTFGPDLAALATCPECGAALDVDVPVSALALDLPAAAPGRIEAEDGPVTFRLPTAGDLKEVTDADALFARCVDRPVDAATRTEIERAMALGDPGAELEVALTCPECTHAWSEVLDPIRFVWAATVAGVRQLATEVDALGRAYGWSEAEILAMSGQRRRLYLGAVAG